MSGHHVNLATPARAQAVADVMVCVLLRLSSGHRRGPVERDVCLSCGCLVLPDEHCPGCAANRERRAA